MISFGWATFAACSVLVISVELTINRNAIKGVHNLNTVRQLIPFCLGVGGLRKVIWAAFMEKDRRVVIGFVIMGSALQLLGGTSGRRLRRYGKSVERLLRGRRWSGWREREVVTCRLLPMPGLGVSGCLGMG